MSELGLSHAQRMQAKSTALMQEAQREIAEVLKGYAGQEGDVEEPTTQNTVSLSAEEQRAVAAYLRSRA